jgi:hypothetical protein
MHTAGGSAILSHSSGYVSFCVQELDYAVQQHRLERLHPLENRIVGYQASCMRLNGGGGLQRIRDFVMVIVDLTPT